MRPTLDAPFAAHEQPEHGSILALSGALVLVVAAIVLAPNAARVIAERQLHDAARQVVKVLQGARFKAVCQNESVAVRFANSPTQGIRFVVSRQGCSGASCAAPAPPSEPLGWQQLPASREVRLGFPNGRAVRDPNSPEHYLARLEDPIRFGGADAVTFDPLGGGARAGALFLTDGARLIAVAVYQGAGAVAILDYDFEREQWSDRRP